MVSCFDQKVLGIPGPGSIECQMLLDTKCIHSVPSGTWALGKRTLGAGVSCYQSVAEVLGQVKFMLSADLPGFIMVEGCLEFHFLCYFDHSLLLFSLRVSQNKAHF